MKPYEVHAKERPKWYQFRLKLSNLFIFLARKTCPKNPELQALTLEQIMHDTIVFGRAIVRIDPSEL